MSTSKFSNTSRKNVGIIVASAMLMLIKFNYIKPSAVKSDFPQVSTQQQFISRIDYEHLNVGMNITEAQATLAGKAIEISRDETTVTYQWVNPDSSKITAIFKRNHLVNKSQSGLK